MKKWLIVIIGFYLVTSVILVLFSTDPQEELEVLSIRKTQSRLMVPEEMLTFDFYVSDPESFFINVENIADSILLDDETEIKIDLMSVIVNNIPLTYLGEQFYPCTFSFSFTEISLPGSKLDISDGICRLIYVNEAQFDLSIGDLSLFFSDVSQILHLDYTRLYAVMNKYGSREFIAGLVLGLDCFTIGHISITGIDTGLNFLHVCLQDALRLDRAISYTEDMSEVLGVEAYYPMLDDENDLEASFFVSGSELFILPLRYLNEIKEVQRFYLIIEYEYLGEKNSFVIDDFVYYQKNPFREVEADEVSRYLYKY